MTIAKSKYPSRIQRIMERYWKIKKISVRTFAKYSINEGTGTSILHGPYFSKNFRVFSVVNPVPSFNGMSLAERFSAAR